MTAGFAAIFVLRRCSRLTAGAETREVQRCLFAIRAAVFDRPASNAGSGRECDSFGNHFRRIAVAVFEISADWQICC